MLWTCSATFLSQLVQVFINHSSIYQKKDTKKPLHRYRKQGGFQKRNSLLIFDALMQRLLHLFYLIHQIINYATPYYEDYRYSFFAPFLSNSILPKKSGELCRIFWIFCILFVNKKVFYKKQIWWIGSAFPTYLCHRTN